MKVTSVLSRRYTVATLPTTQPKGKQRQIVLAILASADGPLTPEQVATKADALGLTAVGGVLPSVRYHLHHLCLLGHASYEAPAAEQKAA